MQVATLVSQNRDDRLLGASEAAAALGISRYRSPMDVWRHKVAVRRGEPPPLRDSNEAMEWGVALEPIVRGKYALSRGARVIVPTTSMEATPRLGGELDIEPWLRCTPDGVVFETPPGASVTYALPPPGESAPLVQEMSIGALDAVDPDWRMTAGLLEVKTTGSHNAELWASGVPEDYEIQVRVQLAVVGVMWCDVVCLIGGQRYVGPYRIERDAKREIAILRDLRAFWSLVEREVAPDVDGSPAWQEYAARQLARSVEETRARTVVEADADVRAFLSDWRIARIERKRASEMEDEIKTELLLRMAAAAATGIDGGDLGKVTAYRTGARTDWKGYASHLEDVFMRSRGGSRAEAERILEEARARYRGEPGDYTLRAPSAWGKD